MGGGCRSFSKSSSSPRKEPRAFLLLSLAIFPSSSRLRVLSFFPLFRKPLTFPESYLPKDLFRSFHLGKAMAARPGKWHPPPAPTRRIIHLPRRSRLSRSAKAALAAAKAKAKPTRLPSVSGRNLGAFLDEERSFAGGGSDRRARVEAATSSGESTRDSGEDGFRERWRFQAEILRAECNFLRMEREVALRKLEKNRAQMEAILRSAVETLISGGKEIDGSERVVTALREEIEELEDKLEELQPEISSRRREKERSCGRNFDRQASVLRRRLEKMADETSHVREFGEIAAEKKDDKEISPLQSDRPRRFPDVMQLMEFVISFRR